MSRFNRTLSAVAAVTLAVVLNAACADPLVAKDCPPGSTCAAPRSPDVVLVSGDNGTTRAVPVGTVIGLKVPYRGLTDVVVSDRAVLGAQSGSSVALLRAIRPGVSDVTVRSSGFAVHVEVE